jgi:protein-S-isoprenylcysteine O-methyltransferase Ste14
MLVPILATTIRLIWVSIEFPYLRRHRMKPAQDWDKHSAKLWDVVNAVEVLGIVVGFTSIGRIEFAPVINGWAGVAFLITGIAIRWVAVYTLGKHFTGTVVIRRDHQLIRSGLYKRLRHPAYTGTLLAHLGLGMSFSNWISLGLSSVPYFLVAWYRMRVEEQALTNTFGAEYIAYTKTTRRLIPGLY